MTYSPLLWLDGEQQQQALQAFHINPDLLAKRQRPVVFCSNPNGPVAMVLATPMMEQHTQQWLWQLQIVPSPRVQTPGFDEQGSITAQACQLLEQHWQSGGDRQVIGAFVTVDGGAAGRLARQRRCEVVAADGTRIHLHDVGYTVGQHRNLVFFFEGATFCFPGEQVPRGGGREPEPPKVSDCEFVFANQSASLRDTVAEFWVSEGVFADTDECAERLDELATVAWHKGQITAVATVFSIFYPSLQASMYGFRCYVGQQYRRTTQAVSLLNATFDALNQWEQTRPQVVQHQGMLFSLQHAATSSHINNARAHRTGFDLLGFDPKNNQVRVRWFSWAQIGN